jgi:7-carboxy-7-deazaguanine synthase
MVNKENMMLNINDIFCSFDGEINAFGQGRRTVFVRFQGCNLKCSWCDQPEAINWKEEKQTMTITDTVDKILEYQCDKVTITGGEPLFQEYMLNDLVCELKQHSIKISVETNGTLEPSRLLFHLVDSWIVDVKPFLPEKDLLFPYKELRPTDFVKFIVTDTEDFYDSLHIFDQINNDRTNYYWSAIESDNFGVWQLINLLDEYKINGGINIQLHKLLELK